ncbi:MAG: AMP-dependent synthetase/ligase, partial [Myxococcota bacterium]
IPHRLFSNAHRLGARDAYFVRRDEGWRGTSWAEYADQVKRAGKSLMALGFEPGQSIAILGFNRPEWAVADLACMAVGGAPAGIYTTCSPEEVRYIADHCEAPVVVVENEEQWRKIEAERDRMPHLRHVVTMQGVPAIDADLVMTWDEFMAAGTEVADADFFARMDALEPDQCATLIYTSGTTGPPKGVMLSHGSLAWTGQALLDLVALGPEDRALSYLPLSHIAEQNVTLHGAITIGVSIYFAESMEALPKNLAEVQPTMFLGVPRVWEKLQAGIAAKLGSATGAKKRLLDWAMGVGRRVSALRMEEGREPTGWLGLQYALAHKLVFSKLKAAIGLRDAKLCCSSAAPLAREVIEFFAALDVQIMEAYGMSENNGGPTTFNLPGRCRLGTVGPAVPGQEVRIADDGEILVRAPNVMLGYSKDPAATDETLRDGWLCTGDLGSFDEDGFLRITGRKKEIIITAGGKNVAPKNIEHAIKNHPLVAEAVVIGDRRKYLSALITLDPEAATAWARERGIAPAEVHQAAALRDELQQCIDEVNSHLARVEQIKRFTVLPRPFTVEAGELTPTMKIKRRVIHEHFGDEIESMYEEATPNRRVPEPA